MNNSTEEQISKCSFLDCNEEKENYQDFCDYHYGGGILGNGSTYNEYQIIEKDFIDFINIVPISEPKHLTVQSPVLRDIIIRSCVQIELFLKEWSLFHCSEYKTYPPFTQTRLWKEYSKLKDGEMCKTRHWKLGSYFLLKEEFFDLDATVFVRPMNININPFSDWINEENPPKWWRAYNIIKHGGRTANEESNLENALNALVALFYLHCQNEFSRTYLEQFESFSISKRMNQVVIEFESITTPIDSKKYLFKYDCEFPRKKIELITKQEIEKPRRKGLF